MEKGIKKASEEGFIQAQEGVYRKTLVYGENMLMAEFMLKGGHVLPMHKHPHEQAGYLVSGHIVFNIEGEEYDILPGDSWVIPGNMLHGAKLLVDSLAVEVFSPVREDYK